MKILVGICVGFTSLFASDTLALSKRKMFAQEHALCIEIPENTHDQGIVEKAYIPDRDVTFKGVNKSIKSLNESIVQTQLCLEKPESQRSAAKVRAAFSAVVSCIVGTVVLQSELCSRPDVGICSGFALLCMTGFTIHQAGSALTRYQGCWCNMALDQDFIKDFISKRYTPKEIQDFLNNPRLRSTLSPTFVKMLETVQSDQE